MRRPTHISLLALLTLIAGAACDSLPDRPDEATYKAADEWERCRLTASRAIMCTDELMVANLNGLDPGFTGLIEDDLAKDRTPPSKERRQNIDIHKTSCQGDIGTGYVDGIFACWSIKDCKKFATCVAEKSSAAKPPARGAAPSDELAVPPTDSPATTDDVAVPPRGSAPAANENR